jgi:hypothetical protein
MELGRIVQSSGWDRMLFVASVSTCGASMQPPLLGGRTDIKGKRWLKADEGFIRIAFTEFFSF